MRLAVIVPHLGQPEHLARCLAALAGQDGGPDGAPDEVIVVDNGSARLPEREVAAHPRARLLREERPGPGPARTTGLAATRADLIAFLDADCVPAPGWARAVRAAFAGDWDGIAGGDVRVPSRAPGVPRRVAAYEALFAFRNDRYVARHGFAVTANLAVRRTTALAIGPFAGLGRAEDRDWCLRARARGVGLRYVPGMAVAHPPRATMADLCRKWDRLIAHDRAEVRTPRDRLAWWAKAALLPLSPLAALPEIAATDRLDGPVARLAAFAGCAQVRLHRARRMAALGLGADPARLAARWREGAA